KKLEVFIEEKGKEDKTDEDVPDIKKGRSTSTPISIESIADHTGARRNFFGKNRRRIFSIKKKKYGENNDWCKKKEKKFDDVEESESDMDSTQVQRKKGKIIVIEIYFKTDKESSPVEKKEKIKMVLTEKYLKKKENKGKKLEVFIEEKGKEEKTDEDVPDIKKGRSTSTPINSSLRETQLDENNTQSMDMQFDEITVQDDVDKKTSKSKKIQCDKDYINED
nr:hypothetical protein [Tanacetum cinerariifolium]